jgi:type II secretory pathway component HofQ
LSNIQEVDLGNKLRASATTIGFDDSRNAQNLRDILAANRRSIQMRRSDSFTPGQQLLEIKYLLSRKFQQVLPLASRAAAKNEQKNSVWAVTSTSFSPSFLDMLHAMEQKADTITTTTFTHSKHILIYILPLLHSSSLTIIRYCFLKILFV